MVEKCLDHNKTTIQHKGKDIVVVESSEVFYFENTDGKTLVFDNQADIIDIIDTYSKRLCSDKKIKDFEKLCNLIGENNAIIVSLGADSEVYSTLEKVLFTDAADLDYSEIFDMIVEDMILKNKDFDRLMKRKVDKVIKPITDREDFENNLHNGVEEICYINKDSDKQYWSYEFLEAYNLELEDIINFLSGKEKEMAELELKNLNEGNYYEFRNYPHILLAFKNLFRAYKKEFGVE